MSVVLFVSFQLPLATGFTRSLFAIVLGKGLNILNPVAGKPDDPAMFNLKAGLLDETRVLVHTSQ